MFSLFRRTGTELATDVEFVPPPDYSEHSADQVMRLIDKNYMKRRKSFGAFVLRGFSSEEMDKLVEKYKISQKLSENRFNRSGKRRVYKETEFTGTRGLHIDNGFAELSSRSAINDVTLHYTLKGMADFIILAGSHGAIFLDEKTRDETTKDLADNGNLDTEYISIPDIAYRTSVGKGDLVVFDHTQPHAFISDEASEVRLSEVHFFV